MSFFRAVAALLLGAAVFSGCQKGQPEGKAIALEARADWEGLTRATLLGTSTLSSVDIGASAYLFDGEWSESLTPNFFHNVPFRYVEGFWISADQYFWPGNGHNLRFFCYAPYDAGILSGSGQAGAPLLQFTVADDPTGQVDLLVADSGTVDGAERTSLPVNFSHALCAVRFAIKAGSRSGMLSALRVSGLYNSATRSLAPGSPWTSLSGNASYALEGSFPYTRSATDRDLFEGDEGVFLLLPQTQDGARIEALYRIQGEEDVLAISTGDFDIAWEPGKIYTYTLEIRESVKITVSVSGFAEVGPDAVFEVGVFPFVPAAGGGEDYTGGNGDYWVTGQ